MAKLVSVQDSSYKLSVNSGGTITFNTGNQVGTVIITGDLTVLGNTVTIDTANLTIEDNIILLNKGETGVGITEDISGIQIERGTLADVQIFFDENRQWLDTQDNITKNGLFVFKNDESKLIGIQTNSITTDGNNLNLLGNDAGTAVIHVNGADDYEQRVLDYTLPGFPAKNDDIIPNIKAVIDYVTEYFVSNPPFKIQDSRIVAGITELADSSLIISDADFDGGDSNLTLTLDSSEVAVWTTTSFTVQTVKVEGSTISGLGSGSDLVLTNPGTGSVKVDDSFKLGIVVSAPAVASDGIKVYAGTEAQGGTGLFFVNTKSTTESLTTRDELISKRKALAYSMIF